MSATLDRAAEASKSIAVVIGTPGWPTYVYRGRNRAEAERIANFWDERTDTYIVEPPKGALAVALFKLDWLIEQLT